MRTAYTYDEEACTTDLREALYFMSHNPPFKFVRLENVQTPKTVPTFFRMVFQGEKIMEEQLRYTRNEPCPVDLSNLKALASEIDSYIKSLEDYSI